MVGPPVCVIKTSSWGRYKRKTMRGKKQYERKETEPLLENWDFKVLVKAENSINSVNNKTKGWPTDKIACQFIKYSRNNSLMS